MCLIALGTYPSIAQLAERETVEAKQLSLGHWFESGWTEIFFILKFLRNVKWGSSSPIIGIVRFARDKLVRRVTVQRIHSGTR